MSLKSRIKNSMAEHWDPAQSHERMGVIAPLFFYDDFLGKEILQTESGSKGIWDTVEVNLNTAIGLVADASGGQVSLAADSDANAEDAVLYWGDQRGLDINAGLVFEFRGKLLVLPTLTGQFVLGLASDHNLAKDSVAVNAWFKFDGDGVCVAETDDGTMDNDDKSTGITVLTTEWHVYRIDFTSLTDVRFYIDGVHVATGTTFGMSAVSASTGILQPYFSFDKDADAGVGTFLLDYVKAWQKRIA